jgi:hypothetical protein
MTNTTISLVNSTYIIVTQNSKSVIIYYAKIYSKMYINLSKLTLMPVGVGVKVPAGSLLTY